MAVRKSVPYRVRLEIMERSDWKCAECGSHRDVQIDHIVAVSLGGSDDPSNLQALCRQCNQSKGTGLRVRNYRGTSVRRVYVAVRLAPAGLAAVDSFAQARTITRSEAIRTLLGAGIAALGAPR